VIPGILLLDQAQLSGEIDGGLGLEARNNLMRILFHEDKLDTARSDINTCTFDNYSCCVFTLSARNDNCREYTDTNDL
jgi:hypothetical protein